jgi:hypothetical protein
MKIMEWVKEWVRSWPPRPACYFCAAKESDELRLVLCQYDDLLVCSNCLHCSTTFWALDSIYWDKHPEEIPPCKHCRKVVPPDQLVQDVRPDWYFCMGCAYDSDVILYWKRIYRRMWERRARGLGVKLRKVETRRVGS